MLIKTINNEVREMLRSYAVTGVYSLELCEKDSSYRIYQPNPDTVFLERDGDRGMYPLRIAMTVKEFQKLSCSRILELLTDFPIARGPLLPARSGQGYLYNQVRLLLLRPLPKGCETYEDYLKAIPELEVYGCDRLEDAAELLRSQEVDLILHYIEEAEDTQGMERYFQELIRVSGRPAEYLPCTLMLMPRRPPAGKWGTLDGVPLVKLHQIYDIVFPFWKGRMPSAAWLARYILSGLGIQNGRYTMSISEPIGGTSGLEMQSDEMEKALTRRIVTEVSCSKEARELLGADNFTQMCIGDSPTQGKKKTFVWRDGVYYSDNISKKAEIGRRSC